MMSKDWATSSFSQKGASNCVECRAQGSSLRKVQVRDTQNRNLGHLSFSATEWSFFISDIKDDRLS
jgi:hypothetical protein